MTKDKELFMDYGDFVVRYDFNQRTLFRAHEIARGILNGGGISLDRIAQSHNTAIQAYLEARKVDYAEWRLERILEPFFQDLGIKDPDTIKKITNGYKFNDHNITPIEGAFPAISGLSRGRNLHIVSNLPHDSIQYNLDRSGLGQFFRTITISCEVGHRKPHPSIYVEALRRAGVAPDQSMFASHEQYEVDGARAIGMEGILARNVSALAEVLK